MRYAFTLIELLVVISIIAILTGFSAAAFNNYSRRQRVVQATAELISTIQDAQSRAYSSVDGLNWGVHLAKGQSSFSLFSTGSSFNEAAEVLNRGFESGIVVSDLTLSSLNTVNIIFSVLTGAAAFTGDDGNCLGGSADSSCAASPSRCLAAEINLQGTTDKRYLKVNERNIFESSALVPCP
jgi:prepilin-type N-terminal cleavage/methylation domain-containing protein